MPKEHIAKALTRLSKAPANGAELCDAVAHVLNRMTSYRVNSLNRDLNFLLASSRATTADLEGESIEEVSNARRAAKLLALTLPPPAGATVDQADSWSYSGLRTFLRAYGDAHNQYRPAGTGYYLKGSFWGFADHAERAWTRVSWTETSRLLQQGINVIRRARGHETAADNLISRWFGTSNRVDLEMKITRLLNGMLTEYVGLCYLGPGLEAAEGYLEYGPNTTLTALKSAMGGTEVGFASPENRRIVGLKARFFNVNSAAVRRSDLHSTNVGGVLEGTRAGALVHELSHVFLRTNDEKLPNAAYVSINRPTPATDGDRHFAYGPLACGGLAKTAPNLSLTNADSYRLFCEDAQVFAG